MTTKIVPISDLRRRATGIIKTLREENNVVYITQHGRPAAVLVDYDAYEAMVIQLQERDDRASLPNSEGSGVEGDQQSFLAVAQAIDLDGPADWSANLDAYLYGNKQLDDR